MTEASVSGPSLARYRRKVLLHSELVAYWAVVFLFVALQVYSSAWLVSDFNWILFVDHDDAYQVEQFLNNMGEKSVEALPEWKAAYGSELFLAIPLYKLIRWIVGSASPVDAYRFLKVLHILAVGSSLLLLRVVMRQSGAPVLVPVLAVALVVSSPRFFAYAQSLKPDANVVLFFLVASFWALLKFDASGKSGWLIASIALGALAAAVKWWGIFLLVPQFYLAAVHAGSGRGSKPLIGWWHLLGANTVLCALFFLTLVVQGRPLVERLPHPYRAVVLVAMAATGLVVAVWFAVTTGGSGLLLRYMAKATGAPASMGIKLSRLLYCFIGIGSLFAAGYVIFAGPFLLSDQLKYSITGYFVAGLLNPNAAPLIANVSRWLSRMWDSGLFLGLMMPAVFGSSILLLGSNFYQEYRKLRAIGFFSVTLLVFLAVLVARVFPAPLMMLLPFVATLAVIPVAMWAVRLNALGRNLVLTTLVLLAGGQTVLQGLQTVDVFFSYRKTIQAISTMNHALVASLNKVSGNERDRMVYMAGRDFPIHNEVAGTKHLTGTEYGDLLNRLLSCCGGSQAIQGLGNTNRLATFVVIQADPSSSFAAYLPRVEKLRNMGCLDPVSEITGYSYRRGSRWRFSYALYQIHSHQNTT